jgi:hypothetical protein
MDEIEKISILGSLLSKKYGKNLFKLLKVYKDISASEASSRLGLHIQTVQDFLEATVTIGLTRKQEIMEKKRPYFRYTLVKSKLILSFSLDNFIDDEEVNLSNNAVLIRERKNSNSHFTIARNGNYFSTISAITGSGRTRKQKKINLTNAQGLFLFHLPFPDAKPISIDEIIRLAGINEENKPEIKDIVNELVDLDVIETIR